MEGRTFTLAEAKSLLPRLEEQLLAVKTEKEVLVRSHGEIKRASANAQANGGSVVGPRYIRALERISDSAEAIQGMGDLVKDLDIGHCDFPFQYDNRVVHRCWRMGRRELGLWNESEARDQDSKPIKTL